MGKPALATTAVRGVYSSQDSVTTSCPCPHLSKVPCSSCEGASSRPLTKVLGILHMPLLLTRWFAGLQPSAFHSQDNWDQICEKEQHLCNTIHLLIDSAQLENTYKKAEIRGNTFIPTKKTFWSNMLVSLLKLQTLQSRDCKTTVISVWFVFNFVINF